MTKRILPRDATLWDVLDTLTKPDDYVCGVIINMRAFLKEREGVGLRIGVTGGGKSPHYRLEVPREKAVFSLIDERKTSIHYENTEAFDGRNHNKLTDPEYLADNNWSVKHLTLDDVTAVLGKIRGR